MTNEDVDIDPQSGPASAPPTTMPDTESTPRGARERVFVGTGLFWGLVAGLLLAVAVVILAAQNTDSMTIAFLGWEFSTPLIVVVLGTLLVGVVLDEVFGLVYRARRRRIMGDRDRLERIERSAANAE